MKIFAWILVLAVPTLWLATSGSLPADGAPALLHVVPRYLERSLPETGLSPFLAVTADYRSADLFWIFLAFLAGSWCFSSRFREKPRGGSWRSPSSAVLLALGLALMVFVALAPLAYRGDFLDYGATPLAVRPDLIRPAGAFLLGLGALAVLFGALSAWTGKEKD